MSETALAKVDAFPDDKIALIKRTVAQGTTNDELELFLYTAKRIGLDPLAGQIHAVKRWNAAAQRETMAIQVGIDGYRLIADRTEKYAPGPEPTFTYNDSGELQTATGYVKKLTRDGTWHTVAATAHFDEYKGTKKGGDLNHMWKTKGHIMLGKCAEALALRRAFPAELSGVYTREEMDQADNPPPQPGAPAPSNSRREVNNGLWKALWNKAQANKVDDDGIWHAVASVRPDLFGSKPKKPANQKHAQIIIDKLTEEDFSTLFAGLEGLNTDEQAPQPPQTDQQQAEQKELDYNPQTGEVYPPGHPSNQPEREPGADDA